MQSIVGVSLHDDVSMSIDMRMCRYVWPLIVEYLWCDVLCVCRRNYLLRCVIICWHLLLESHRRRRNSAEANKVQSVLCGRRELYCSWDGLGSIACTSATMRSVLCCPSAIERTSMVQRSMPLPSQYAVNLPPVTWLLHQLETNDISRNVMMPCHS